MPGDIWFGCHKGEPGTGVDLACAGWLAQFGGDHVGVRLAIAQGRLPDGVLAPGLNWPPLHEDWADVVQAQTSSELSSGLVLASTATPAAAAVRGAIGCSRR
ncbi:DUF6283 family protein [Actinoplanes sp. NPDC049265]|uniref:DUF6283 family protein n=1 Tax=Actinoplanes sp. NPDC049265 TaxID=3363902 RepID=UPI00371366E8